MHNARQRRDTCDNLDVDDTDAKVATVDGDELNAPPSSRSDGPCHGNYRGTDGDEFPEAAAKEDRHIRDRQPTRGSRYSSEGSRAGAVHGCALSRLPCRGRSQAGRTHISHLMITSHRNLNVKTNMVYDFSGDRGTRSSSFSSRRASLGCMPALLVFMQSPRYRKPGQHSTA